MVIGRVGARSWRRAREHMSGLSGDRQREMGKEGALCGEKYRLPYARTGTDDVHAAEFLARGMKHAV